MEEAFEEWFVELWRVSFRVAYRLRGNRADAEDLASAALSDALCAWAEIRVPAAWVATVTARKGGTDRLSVCVARGAAGASLAGRGAR